MPVANNVWVCIEGRPSHGRVLAKARAAMYATSSVGAGNRRNRHSASAMG